MSGKVVANHPWSCTSLHDVFRFSPRANLAHTIKWRSWNKVAFEEANRLEKPIFLVISSSWCQWCHIMDETTLSEPSIITIVNNDYIPIRVDSDLRPDVNQRYNRNGWPSVVILSAEGEPLWGGVYVPPKQMLYYLGHVRRYYSENRHEISTQVQILQDQRFTRPLTQELPRTGLRALLEDERAALADLPAQAGRILQDLYDAEYGGFTIHPHLKFPHPEALELLLLHSRQQPALRELVCYSLAQMRDGGLWDHEEGGFFRYSAASDWSTPHTEKMLEENAAMLRLVLLTAEVTQEQVWYELAKRLVLYVNTTLWQPDIGIFSGSQSADEEYYEPGPYSRASREAPYVDKTIYTACNARIISAYFLAAKILKYPSLASMSLRALDSLCQRMMHQDGCMYHYAIDGRADLAGQLADQVWMTRALLDAYDACADKSYLEVAIALMHFVCQQLLDRQSGLFFDYPEGPAAVGRLLQREQPLTENAIAAECLLRMGAYSKRKNLHDTALLVLSGCLDKYRRTGIQGAIYACVVRQALEDRWL